MTLPKALLADADRQIEAGTGDLAGGPDIMIRFENSLDGWISGSMTGKLTSPGVANGITDLVVWSTHNGGTSWTPNTLPGFSSDSSYFDLEASTTKVYVLGVEWSSYKAIVDSSPIESDHWTRSSLAPMSLPAGGGQPSGAIVIAGSHGWLEEGNDRGVIGSAELNAKAQWVPWKSPCQSVGDTMAYPVPSSPTRLIGACQIGGFGGDDSGPVPPGAKLGSTWLYISTNAGATFKSGLEIAKTYSGGATILAAPSTSTLLAVDEYFSPSVLVVSFDGGLHWSKVGVSGDTSISEVVSLRFVAPMFGFGLVQNSNDKSAVIETTDGGHAWTVIAG
jgi:hypothetical protein